MTKLTDEAVKALLDGATPGPWRADGEPWNRVVWSSAENRVCFMAHSNGLNDERDIATSNLAAAAPDLARALLDARADAKVAVAVEKAVAVAEVYSDAEVMGRITGDTEIADAISALASEDAIAEVAKLRAERDAALADVARFQEERTYVIGANDGWDAAVEQGEASPAVEKAMVRFWKKLAETHNERADRLADELTAANAREAGLQNLPPDYGHDGVRWKIGTAMRRSIDAASPLTDRDAALYHAFRAGLRAALASSPAQNEGDAT